MNACVRRISYLAVVGSVLAAGMSGTFSARTAHAQFGVCVGDPTFILSNGYQLEATVTENGGPEATHALKQISYRIQIPRGVKVLAVHQAVSSPSIRQTWTFASDPLGANGYWTRVSVTESPAKYPVVLTQTVENVLTGASSAAIISAAPAKALTLTTVIPQAP